MINTISTNNLRRILMSSCVLAFYAFTPANAEPITHTDQAGHQLTFDKIPENIVAITGASNVITVDGGGDRLAGTSPRSRNTILEGVLNEFFPVLNDLPMGMITKQGVPNIEEMLNLKTDLALQWARKSKSIEAMENAGIPVVALKYSKVGMEKSFLTDVGVILRQDAKVKKILAWHDETYKRITDKTKAIAEDKKPKVLFLLRETFAAGPSSHFQFTMDTAGARNALDVKGRFIDVDAELILKSDPDVIWLMGWNPKLMPETFLKNPIYADLKAVKNHRIYKVPVGGDHWDAPNQEFPLAWEWFTRTLHPELLEGSIRDSVKAAFPMLYGHTPTDKQLDMILRVKVNKSAANYDIIAR